MSQENKYPFAKAGKVADYLVQLLKPHCTRIHIAGSIRRLQPQVKDIEIICQPKKTVLKDLFGWDEGYITDVDFTQALATISHSILKGNVEGRYMQILTNSKNCPGIQLDLFMPQPDDYYRIYAIRTGSSEYSHAVLANAWKRNGWTGIKDLGLRRISECESHTSPTTGKKTYYLKKEITNPQLPPVWQSEAEFFAWLGVEYIDPEYRVFQKTLNEAQ
jgi:DNA polymerase/3'-5' exonuclease PolX